MSNIFGYAASGDYDRISRFLHEYWANNHIYCRDRKLFDWTFDPRGIWKESDYCFAIAEDNDELVGILGGIPFRFNHFGKTSQGVWIVNYVIRPDHRRGTTALKLLSTFRRPPVENVIAFGINPATSAIYRVLRGEVLPYIPRHYGILPFGQERMVNILRIAYPDWPADRAQSLAEAFRMDSLPDGNIAHETSLPEDWDQNQWPRIAERTIGAARDLEYLTWRYLKHPDYQYQVICIPSNGQTGLLIWRLETIRQATPEGRAELDKIGRIVEFLPVSAQNARDLLAVFYRKLCVAGGFAADYYGFHGESRDWLEQAGILHTDRHPDGIAMPSRFQPLDGKGGGILSAAFLQSGLPACTPESMSTWYWTKSDSDQDRPN